MRRVLVRATCALFLLTSVLPAGNLLDTLTLRIETPADTWNLRLGGVLPVEILDSIDAGDTDLRHLVLYDAPARQLSIRTFMVPGGSPAPTSLLVVQNNEVEGFRVDVSDIALDEAKRTVTFTGVVAEGEDSPVHGASSGEGIQLTATYGATARSFDQFRIDFATGADLLSHAGQGALVLETTPNRPPVAKASPQTVESFMTEVVLNALQSYDPDGEELDYKWHVIGGAATLRGCETPTATLQLLQGQGIYDVRLTITDSRGASSYDYVRVKYVGR